MRRRPIIKRNYDREGNLIRKESTRCHKIKSVSKFSANTQTKDRLQSQCNKCRKIKKPKHNQGKKKQIVRNYDNKGNLISKECCYCHEIKPVSKFNKNTKGKDGFQTRCKECSKKYRQEYKQENPNYDKEHYQENKCEIKKRKKEYYQENKESKKEYNRKRRQENPDFFKEYDKKRRDKKRQEVLQQIEIEIKSNPEKYNYREGEKIFGIIYSVHNIKSNRYYVGQTTTTFDIRYPSGWLYEHGHKKEVKEDLELYGEDSFEYIKIFKVAYSQHDLDILEAHYIDYYDSYENGYNGTRGNIFTNRGKEK